MIIAAALLLDWRILTALVTIRPTNETLTETHTPARSHCSLKQCRTRGEVYALYEGTIKKVMHVTQDTPSRINDAQRFFEDYAKQENYFRQPPLRESDFNPIVANVLTAGAWLPPKLRENGNPPLDIRDRLEIPKLVESTMKGRTCYFTDSSRFGMGPGCIRKGDVLVSIPGGSSLIALRPLEYDAIYEASYQTRISHTETTMTVVGDCYVHGLHELMQQQLQKIECKYRIV
jgi:hypothetical protein